LLEIYDGTDYRLSHEPKGQPIADYIKMQGRFRHLTDDSIASIQQNVDEDWERLQGKLKTKKASRYEKVRMPDDKKIPIRVKRTKKTKPGPRS